MSTIEASVSMGAVKKTEYAMIIVDTTVQEKAIAHPTAGRLLEIARHKVVSCDPSKWQFFARPPAFAPSRLHLCRSRFARPSGPIGVQALVEQTRSEFVADL